MAEVKGKKEAEVEDFRFKTSDSAVKERAIAAGFNVVEARGKKHGGFVLGKEYVFDAPADTVNTTLGLTPIADTKKEKR